jgi:hypothetical protein
MSEHVTEFRRALDVPRVPPEALQPPPEYFAWLYRPGATHRLNAVQERALYMAEAAGGLFANLAVGSGKTLITLLVAQVMRASRPVLMIPPSMLETLTRENERFSRSFIFNVVPRVVPYSMLSGQTNYGTEAEPLDILESLAPDLIILDEAHQLSAADSARTRRFLRYMKANPTTRLVCVSGTLAKTGLQDFAHLMEWALRQHCPLPCNWKALDTLGKAVNTGDDCFSLTAEDWRFVQPLVARFGSGVDLLTIGNPEHRRAEVRRALHERIKTAPGVVLTSESSVNVPLVVTEVTSLQTPPEIASALAECQATWKLPGGEEILSALELASRCKEIALGFHYFWEWGARGPDWSWLEARAEYRKALRLIIAKNKARLDTPGLIEKALESGRLDDNNLRALQAHWYAEAKRYLRETGQAEPPVKTRWLSHYLVQDVAERLQYLRSTGARAVVWYSHTAVAEKLAEIPGLVVIPPGKEVLAFDFVACSVDSHGTGHNLQRWPNSIILCPPSGGAMWEQVLGRSHRQGQSQAVNVLLYSHTPHLKHSLEVAGGRSNFIQDVFGQRQKFLNVTARHKI